jgi:hypothetical protein
MSATAVIDFFSAFIDQAGHDDFSMEDFRLLWESEGIKKLKAIIKKNEKKKEKKAKKDAGAPKGAKSSYIFFCIEERVKIKEEDDSLKNTEIIKLMGKRWKKLSDEEKEHYVEMAAEDRDRYKQEMADYVPSEETEEVPKKKSVRTKSGYQLFCDDERATVKEEGFTGKEIMKELGRRWKALPEEDEDRHQEYMEKAAELKSEKSDSESEAEVEEKPKKKNKKSKVKEVEVVEEEVVEKPKKKKGKKSRKVESESDE